MEIKILLSAFDFRWLMFARLKKISRRWVLASLHRRKCKKRNTQTVRAALVHQRGTVTTVRDDQVAPRHCGEWTTPWNSRLHIIWQPRLIDDHTASWMSGWTNCLHFLIGPLETVCPRRCLFPSSSALSRCTKRTDRTSLLAGCKLSPIFLPLTLSSVQENCFFVCYCSLISISTHCWNKIQRHQVHLLWLAEAGKFYL